MSVLIKELITNLVVTRNEYAAYAAAKCMSHYERCATSVTVSLEVYGRDVIVST